MRWYTSRAVALICVIVVVAVVFHSWKHYVAFYNQEVARSAKAMHYWTSICESGARMVHDDFVDCDGVRRRKDANVYLNAIDQTFQHLLQDVNPFSSVTWCERGSKCDFLISWTVTTLVSNLYTFMIVFGVIIIAIMYAFVHYTRLKSQQVQMMREYQQRQHYLGSNSPQHHNPSYYQPLLSPQSTPSIQYIDSRVSNNNHGARSNSSMSSQMASPVTTTSRARLTAIPELESDDDSDYGTPMLAAYSTYTNMRSRGSPH